MFRNGVFANYAPRWLARRSGCRSEPAASRGRTRDAFSESRMREIRPSGSMSGGVETEQGVAREAPATERAGKRIGRT